RSARFGRHTSLVVVLTCTHPRRTVKMKMQMASDHGGSGQLAHAVEPLRDGWVRAENRFLQSIPIEQWRLVFLGAKIKSDVTNFHGGTEVGVKQSRRAQAQG